MMRFVVWLVALTVPFLQPEAFAQSRERHFEVAGHVSVASSDEFDGSDVGVGGRFGWSPRTLFGAEAEISVYPGEFPGEGRAFSRRRWEGFFGATVGPRLGRFRPFAKVRPGFVSYEDSGPFACILIYPPPLACTLAGGATVPAFDLGGGLDVSLSQRSFMRLDVGDRLLRYEGPAFGEHRVVHDDNFWSHDFRLSVGGGVRF